MGSDTETAEGESQEGVDFSEYREMDVSITADGFADLTSLDVNGTELILKQHEHIPVIVEIYVGSEEEPLGAFNIAKGETVTLGGVQENLSDDAGDMAQKLRELAEVADEADELAYRLNPSGREQP